MDDTSNNVHSSSIWKVKQALPLPTYSTRQIAAEEQDMVVTRPPPEETAVKPTLDEEINRRASALEQEMIRREINYKVYTRKQHVRCRPGLTKTQSQEKLQLK